MIKLYEKITAENWLKGSLQVTQRADNDPTGFLVRSCLGGHVLNEIMEWRRDEVIRDLVRAARVLFPERIGKKKKLSPAQRLVRFNDHPDTTVDDVRRVCKVADR